MHFICGERNKPDDVLEDVCKYIEEKNYTIPVADSIVSAAANALNINIKIYENDKGVKKEIDFEPDNAHSSVTVHLLYSCDSNPDADPNNLTSHYDALVLRDDAPISKHRNEAPESSFMCTSYVERETNQMIFSRMCTSTLKKRTTPYLLLI